jgi:hypothetical protein
MNSSKNPVNTPEETKPTAKEDIDNYKEPEFPEEYMIRMRKVEEQRKAQEKYWKEHVCMNYKFIKYLRRECPCKERNKKFN